MDARRGWGEGTNHMAAQRLPARGSAKTNATICERVAVRAARKGRAGREKAKDLPTLPSKPLLNVGTFVGMPIRGCRGTRLLSRHPARGLGRGAPHISRAPVALDLLQRMQHARAYQ